MNKRAKKPVKHQPLVVDSLSFGSKHKCQKSIQQQQVQRNSLSATVPPSLTHPPNPIPKINQKLTHDCLIFIPKKVEGGGGGL
eukprot:4641737-Amphidinium_carterae.1